MEEECNKLSINRDKIYCSPLGDRSTPTLNLTPTELPMTPSSDHTSPERNLVGNSSEYQDDNMKSPTIFKKLPNRLASVMLSNKFSLVDPHEEDYQSIQFPFASGDLPPRKADYATKQIMHAQNKGKHGSLLGVLMPTCENMWGVLIFLRFYYIVGQSGFLQAVLIVILATLNALLTSTSLSAMATSGGSISWGGPYHMITKTLGPQLGVTIGIVYYMGNTLIAILEVLGAIETLQFSTSHPALHFYASTQILSVILILVLVSIMVFGGKYIHKMSALFAAIVVITIIFTIIGILNIKSNNPHITGWKVITLNDNLFPQYTSNHKFADMFGLFFPCFAAFMSGASRAKSLVAPSKNIPRGTFGVIILSFLMYILLMLLWAGVAHRKYLIGEKDYLDGKEGRRVLSGSPDGGQIIQDMAFPHEIVIEIGITISCFSQCLQCLIVASKMLSKIAQDGLIKWLRPLGVLRKDEPVRALFATLILSIPLLLTGSVDIVAPILSCCFFMIFVFINISCFTLSLFRPASWRPYNISKGRWRFLYISLSLIGFFLNIILMFLINWYEALGVMAFAIALYIYVEIVNSKEHGGSALRGLFLHFALSALRHLKEQSEYTINWRPQLVCIMEMEKNVEENGNTLRLLTVANHLKKAQGLCLAVGISYGDPTNLSELEETEKLKTEMESALKRHSVEGFSEIVVSCDFLTGYSHILQISGLGGLVPNTVLLEFPSSIDVEDIKTEQLVSSMKIASELGKAIIVAKTLDDFIQLEGKKMTGNIDLWWIINDGGLMLLLAHFLMQHRIWRKCKLRVFVIGDEADEKSKVEKNMWKLMEDIGVVADEVNVVRKHIQLYEPYLRTWTIGKKKREKLRNILKSHGVAPIPSQVASIIPNAKKLSNRERLREYRKVVDRDPSLNSKHQEVNDSCNSEEAHDVHSIVSIQELTDEEEQNEEELLDITQITQDPYQTYLRKVQKKFYNIPNAIGDKSKSADLVILNLPEPNFKKDCYISKAEYMIYLSRITNKLNKVLLVHGSGAEMIHNL